MHAFRELLGMRGVRPLLFASTFPRLAYAMVSLSIFFLVEDATGSLGIAGLAVGLSSALGALTAGPRGLLVDRFGQTLPILVMTPAYALACLALALFAHSVPTAIVLSALVGVCAPPINLSIRPLWQDIVGAEHVRTAYSLDSAWMNTIQLIGPVLATAIALRLSPTAAIVTVGTCMLIGGLLLAVNPHSRNWVPETRHEGEHGLMRSHAMRLMALEGIAMGLSMGLVTIGIPALATEQGRQGSTGWLLAAGGLGAIIGTAWAGARAKHVAPAPGLRMSTLLYAIALVPLPFLPIGPAMFVVLLVAYTFLGPAHVYYLETVDIVRPRGTAVAALGTLWMIEGAAAGLGNALGGSVAQAWGPHLTLALGCIAVVGSPLVLTAGLRSVLRPAMRPPVTAQVPRGNDLTP